MDNQPRPSGTKRKFTKDQHKRPLTEEELRRILESKDDHSDEGHV